MIKTEHPAKDGQILPQINLRYLQESKFSDSITNKKKTRKWAEITLEINSVSTFERSCTELRKKWSD
jgi:hypothetical protein